MRFSLGGVGKARMDMAMATAVAMAMVQYLNQVRG